jgi:hypothetical protein
MVAKRKTRKIHRSAITGRFVKSGYAKRYPKTTITQTIKTTRKK